MKTYKKLFSLSIITFFSVISASAQTPDSNGVYGFATIMPAYQGGDDALFDFIHQNIKYPKDAWEQKKQGAVQVRAIIDEQGNIAQMKVVRGICPSLDEEAKRVISSTTGKWISGKVDDKPIKTYKYLKISFKIDTNSIEPAAMSKPIPPITFIGGDEAFDQFIKKYITVPNAVLIHPNLWGAVTVSVSFNSFNQITDVAVVKGPYKDLNEEGVRLIKLSQGKWIRAESAKAGVPINAIVTIPFNENMIDSNARKKFISENIILVACYTNPVFKRAYDNYEAGNYDVAIIDLEDCISKKENLDAALAIRAFCYLNTGNNAAACEDLTKLRMKPGMDSSVEEIYYKYCASAESRIGIHPSGWGK